MYPSTLAPSKKMLVYRFLLPSNLPHPLPQDMASKSRFFFIYLLSISTYRSKSPYFSSSGGSRISRKGIHMYLFKGLGVRVVDFISFFLNIPCKRNNLVSLRPNYFIFIGYLKRVGGGSRGRWGSSEAPEPPLDPPQSSLTRV